MENCEEELKRLKDDIKLLVEDRMEAGMKLAKVLAERVIGKRMGC